MSEKGVWKTVSGRRVWIADGQSLSDAMKKSGKFKKMSDSQKKRLKDNAAAKKAREESNDAKIAKKYNEKVLTKADKINEKLTSSGKDKELNSGELKTYLDGLRHAEYAYYKIRFDKNYSDEVRKEANSREHECTQTIKLYDQYSNSTIGTTRSQAVESLRIENKRIDSLLQNNVLPGKVDLK